jgi:hypothetical protein
MDYNNTPNGLSIFQNFVLTNGNERYATRKQIEKLYDVAKSTLAENINTLKDDGLINGSEIRSVAKDGKQRIQELFDINEIVAIGFRLRSNTAIKLQRYAANLLIEKIQTVHKEKRLLELELSYAWNKSDQNDLYR